MNFIDEIRDRLLLRFPAKELKETMQGSDAKVEYTVKIPVDDNKTVTDIIYEVQPMFPWLDIKVKQVKHKKGSYKIIAKAMGDQPAETLDQINTLPITFYVGDDIISLASDGDTFSILKNGEMVEVDFPSPAYAIGSMLQFIVNSMTNLETSGIIPTSSNEDLIAGMAELVINLPGLSKEAKKHFIKFYELVTLKDFKATLLHDE